MWVRCRVWNWPSQPWQSSKCMLCWDIVMSWQHASQQNTLSRWSALEPWSHARDVLLASQGKRKRWQWVLVSRPQHWMADGCMISLLWSHWRVFWVSIRYETWWSTSGPAWSSVSSILWRMNTSSRIARSWASWRNKVCQCYHLSE